VSRTTSATSGDRRGLRAAAVAAALLLLVLPAAALGQATTPVEDLYDPGVLTRHAVVNFPVTARTAPDWKAPGVARLGMTTEDDTSELVLVLARTLDSSGNWWLQVRLPVRPNGRTGWVPRETLGELHRVSSWLKIDRARTRLTLVRANRVVFRARIGVGRPESPTPAGEFYVRNKLSGPRLGAMYGSRAFGTSAHSDVLTDWPGGGVIGIHGTNRPGLLPGRVSHGCVRLRNADIVRLDRILPIGTPITIT
jgi:hypothetical protein